MEAARFRRIGRRPEERHLVGEERPRPLAEAVHHERLRVPVAVMRDGQVDEAAPREAVDVVVRRELDLVRGLLLELRNE